MFDFTNYTTRRLIGLKNACYGDAHAEENYGIEPRTDPSREEIMAELNTREHVPNKLEAKKIRQERAKRNNRKAR